MSKLELHLASAGGLLLAAALFVGNPSSTRAAANFTSPNERRPAPDFVLKDSHGATVRLSDYKGKVVLLNFRATWCGPCKIEIPWFIEFENKYKASGFEVLGVPMDDDGWDAVRPFLHEKGINYRVVTGNDDVAAKYGGVDALPQTFLIDREGRIAARYLGLAGKNNYEMAIEKILRK